MRKAHSLEMDKAKASYQEVLTNRDDALVYMRDQLDGVRQQLQAAHQQAQEAVREKDKALAALSKEVSHSTPCMWSWPNKLAVRVSLNLSAVLVHS